MALTASEARAVAEIALIDAQTRYLIGEDLQGLKTLLSALNYIASNGVLYSEVWSRGSSDNQ
jgi:hypothetical protein